MYTLEFNGINSFLVGMSKKLLEDGVKRITRNEICWELPYPVLIKISNPLARWITIPERKWMLELPYVESLWIASGRNDLDIIEYYLPSMKKFSDDNKFIRGAYGPRFRSYTANTKDYENSFQCIGHSRSEDKLVDQFKYIVESFKRDPFTRQAIITIGDPPKDCFGPDNNLKVTKDFPCTRSLQFMKCPIEEKLNLTVYMRSNDLIWGASAVNIFNYTFMQEYFASILGLAVGDYYHFANNIHFYERRHAKVIEDLAAIESISDEYYNYNKTFHSLSEFDSLLKDLEIWEDSLRNGEINELCNLNDDFFNDWAKVLFLRVKKKSVEFTNPILNHLSNHSVV